MEAANDKPGFRDRSSSRGARGGRGSFQGRGGRGSFQGRGGRGSFQGRGGRGSFQGRGGRGSFEGRGGRGSFEGRGGRGRGIGIRGGEARGRGRGRGSGERGGSRGRGQSSGGRGRGGDGRGRVNFRGGPRGEGRGRGSRGRGRGDGSFRGGFLGRRASSLSPSRGDSEKRDHNDTENDSFGNRTDGNSFSNGEMRGNVRHQRGGRSLGRGRGRGQRHEGNSLNLKAPSIKQAQREGVSENQDSTGKTRPQDVRRKYKLEPEETKKAVLISNLPKKIESLHEEFKKFISSSIGPVKLITYKKITTCKVAFVNAVCVFEEASDFKLALKKLHGQEFQDHHLLVQDFKNSVFDKHHTSHNCVCVTNMSEKTSEENLWKHFEGCGTLGMIHINRNISSGAPLEAIINFNEPDGVTAALKLDGTKLLDSEIKVVHLARSLSILVTNLNRQTTYQEIKELFSDCNLAYFTFCRKIKKEQKSAIMYLVDESSHEKALSLNGKELRGSTISVASGTDKEAGVAYDVFLLNVPKDIPAKEVIKVFRKFGDVQSVKIPFKKCVSRISFKEADQAQAAALCSTVTIRGQEFQIFPTIGKAIKTKKRDAKKQDSVPSMKVDENGKTLKRKKSPVEETSKKSKPKKNKLSVSSERESDSQDSDSLENVKECTQNIIPKTKVKKQADNSRKDNNKAITSKKLKKSSQSKMYERELKREPEEESSNESSNDEVVGYLDNVLKNNLSPSKKKLKTKFEIKEEVSSDNEEEANSSYRPKNSPWEEMDEMQIKREIKEESNDESSDDGIGAIANASVNLKVVPHLLKSSPRKTSEALSKSLPSKTERKRKRKDSSFMAKKSKKF